VILQAASWVVNLCYSIQLTFSQIWLWKRHLRSLHCTVIVFAFNWESHKSLKHDRECLTELLERACFQPYPIQRIQLAEIGWESDNKGFERKRGWVVCTSRLKSAITMWRAVFMTSSPSSSPRFSLQAVIFRTTLNKITSRRFQQHLQKVPLCSGTVAFNLCVAPLKSRTYLDQQRQLPWSFLSGRTEHPRNFTPLSQQARYLQNLPITASLKGLHKKRYCRIDVISELKCM